MVSRLYNRISICANMAMHVRNQAKHASGYPKAPRISSSNSSDAKASRAIATRITVTDIAAIVQRLKMSIRVIAKSTVTL